MKIIITICVALHLVFLVIMDINGVDISNNSIMIWVLFIVLILLYLPPSSKTQDLSNTSNKSGYIVLHDYSGDVFVNVRSILRYEEYQYNNPYSKRYEGRVYLLDNTYRNVLETTEEIEQLIKEQI